MQVGEFHLRNGLTFRRNDDGSVQIRLYPNGSAGIAPTLDLTVPAIEWESVEHELSWNAIHRRAADSPGTGEAKAITQQQLHEAAGTGG